jgi:hypothetical protein
MLSDTSGNIKGKVVDSITSAPIPFATVIFYKNGSVYMKMVSNEKGEFLTDVKSLSPKVDVSAIGFMTRTYTLAFDRSNLLQLTPANNLLPNVMVSGKAGKRPDASKIIKKVNTHLGQNYGDFSYDQKFRVYSTSLNYDTTKGEATDVLLLHFNKEQKSVMHKSWHRDTAKYDASFFSFIGVPALGTGDIIPYADILRKGLVTGEKRIKNFDFRLKAHYQDARYGSVYLVSFKVQPDYNDFFLVGKTVEMLPLGYLKGEMIIREDDYAVVSLKYIWELKNEKFNASLENAYHSRYWKATRLSKIISNSIIYTYEYTYGKDAVDDKYHVETIKADCYQVGYQVENHRAVQLYYQFDVLSLGIENID